MAAAAVAPLPRWAHVRVCMCVTGLALACRARRLLRGTEGGYEGRARWGGVPLRVWRTDLYALPELLKVPVHVADGAQRVVGG